MLELPEDDLIRKGPYDIMKSDSERRSEARSTAHNFDRVEFSINTVTPAYQFGIREISSSGMGILVKENSEVVRHLKVGDRLEMQYHPSTSAGKPAFLKTEIRHITKDEQGRYQGHYIIGLLIIDDV